MVSSVELGGVQAGRFSVQRAQWLIVQDGDARCGVSDGVPTMPCLPVK
jgi:hypothetical protein